MQHRHWLGAASGRRIGGTVAGRVIGRVAGKVVGAAIGSTVVLCSALGCDGDTKPAYALLHASGDGTGLRLSVVSTLGPSGTAELEAAGDGALVPAPHLSLFTLEHSGVAYSPDPFHGILQEFFVERGPMLWAGRDMPLDPVSRNGEALVSLIPISTTKVYLYDHFRAGVAVWNPREMTLTRQFDVGLGIAGGYSFRTFVGSRLDGSELLLLTHSWSDARQVAHDLTVTRIDVETDTVLSHELDERCTGLGATTLPNGDLYLATRPEVAVAQWRATESSIRPCALRLRAGSTSLDPSWQTSFGDALDSSVWGGLHVGARGELLTLVASETEATADPDGALWAPIWQLWEVDPESGSAQPHGTLPSLPVASHLSLDSTLYLRLPSDTAEQGDTLLDISDPSAPVAGIRLPPGTTGILRIR